MLLGGLPNHQTTPINTTNMSKKRHTKEAQIKAIREAEHVSQPVFARYLNVSKNLVSDWERGAKKPGGPALRLLSIIQRSGLDAVA